MAGEACASRKGIVRLGCAAGGTAARLGAVIYIPVHVLCVVGGDDGRIRGLLRRGNLAGLERPGAQEVAAAGPVCVFLAPRWCAVDRAVLDRAA